MVPSLPPSLSAERSFNPPIIPKRTVMLKDAFHFLEQQVIALSSSPPVLLVHSFLDHVPSFMCAHEPDNVAPVQTEGPISL